MLFQKYVPFKLINIEDKEEAEDINDFFSLRKAKLKAYASEVDRSHHEHDDDGHDVIYGVDFFNL